MFGALGDSPQRKEKATTRAYFALDANLTA
jgi:hypothetical protein